MEGPLLNNRKNLLCISMFLLFSALGMDIAQQRNSVTKKYSVKGRIIGYSMRSRLRSVQGRTISSPRDAFLFLVEQGSKELTKGDYIKLQYRATPQHSEELPSALFEEAGERLFVIQRDETCDESSESFIEGEKFARNEIMTETEKTFPNLVRLRAAENIRLPDDRVLRCYLFESAGIGNAANGAG